MRSLFAGTILFILSLVCFGQSAAFHAYSGSIVGPTGKPVAGADIRLEIAGHTLRTASDGSGDFVISTPLSGPAAVEIHAAGFDVLREGIAASRPAQLKLMLATDVQRIVVTASKTPMALDQSASAVQTLSKRALQRTPALAVGDKLRQVTGLTFFRRTSTLAANPTSQGVSLRGLGSTAASRTLVLADGIPISDPFGGWVHWDQVPSLAIQNVEVVSGGISSLYGSGAIGGAINILERQPNTRAYAIDTGWAQENTPHGSALATDVWGPWSGLVAGDILRTGGYIEVAPAMRGPIDTRANVHYENGEILLRRTFAERAMAYLRGNVLNEARNNGTPLQKNATRLWRYSGGVDWDTENAGTFAARLFGSQEHYRQSFSSVPAGRDREFLTRLQNVSTQQLGASGQWTKLLSPGLTLVAGADANDVRATNYEVPISRGNPNGLSDTSARQRDVGEYVEGIWQADRWTLIGSARGDVFLNRDAVQYLQTGTGPIVPTRIADRSEAIFSPKLGVVRRVGRHVALTASGYRAFRSPTMNELYRQSQVGQAVTLANPQLQSERATGWETGAEFTFPARYTRVRASYFWTEVNRPVTALTLSVSPTRIVKQRANLGQIRSRGVALDYQTEPLSWLSITGGYQHADATVTRFSQQPQLVGKWIPQVAQNIATMQVRASQPRIGAAGLLGTLSGRQFDDDTNTFLLHGYFQLDGYVSHAVGSRVELYGAVSNVFDRSIEVGRSPLLTLATPRMASFGIRLHSPDSASR